MPPGHFGLRPMFASLAGMQCAPTLHLGGISLFATAASICVIAGCGSTEKSNDAGSGSGYPWSFEQPHPERIHPAHTSGGFLTPPSCVDYPVIVNVDTTTSLNHAHHGPDSVWGVDADRRDVWIVPRGFASERADHFFECGRNSRWETSEIAFSCGGWLAVPLDAYESGWVRPTFPENEARMIWSYYDENREHLADFEFEFEVIRRHENPNYRGTNDCYRLFFRRTIRKIEGGR